MKNKITACIIVKDEENNLPICLSSIRNYCSQIVVVDTGSSDKTPIIASRFGAELYFHKWEEDFAKARNYALGHARNPWILSIDADEYVESLQIGDDILENPKVGGINLKILNFLDENPTGPKSEHRYTRIFRNNRNIRFEGAIHEQVRESIEAENLEIVESDITIYHTGYINTSEEKRNRNRDMLAKESEKEASDWNIFHLAESEFSLKNNDEAEKLYLQILDSNELNQENIDKAKVRLGQIYLSNELYDKAISILDFKAKEESLEGLRQFVLGATFLNNKDYVNAKKMYNSEEIQRSELVDKNVVNTALQILDQIEK